jgi:uncharacterized protein YfdQ (DUF2303 family)
MLDQAAIKELNKSQAISAAETAITGQVDTLVALPDDFKVHDLENYLVARRRARGTMQTSSVTDFAQYATTHKEEGAAVFVDADDMEAVAVLNLGTPDDPGHADNRAKLKLKKTAAFMAMMQHASGTALKQATAAEFLEDWTEHTDCYNDEGNVSKPKAIAAVRKLTIESMRKLESSEQSLSASKSAFESIQATSADPLPTIIYFRCVPYVGLAERQFVLRLGVQTGGDKPSIVLRIVKAELHAEEMANELAELTREALDNTMPVLIGEYAKAN